MGQEIIHISVRELVEFLLRFGDIDHRKKNADPEAMQMGSRLHRKLQKQEGKAYRAEVPLSYTREYDGFTVEIEGRADGILSGEVMTIDEIKGVFTDVRHLEEPNPVHLAQAKVYAAIYAEKYALPAMKVRMTYGSLENEEIRRFEYDYGRDELAKWFSDLLVSWYPWAKFQYEWKKLRNRSAKESLFPYPYREGQKEVAASVYKTILRNKNLFLMAPTGVGKTIATVFPGVKAVGEGLVEKIFYLTARTTTQGVAAGAVGLLQKNGLRFKSLTITAKEKICFTEETVCEPEACPYAKGHFDRINDAVYDALENEDRIDRETIQAYAKKHKVCPFELSLDLSYWMDFIICDYNYLFDPNAHLKRFFSESGKKEYLFLIDEAHNLVERGRDMYSAVLKKSDLSAVRKLVKGKNAKLYRKIGTCLRDLMAMQKEGGKIAERSSIGNLGIHLFNLMGEMEDFLDEPDCGDMQEEMLAFYLEIREFLGIYELYDEKYVIYTEEDGDFYLHLFCADPSENLKKCFGAGRSAVFFSATFLPIRYYRDLLGADPEDYAIYAESPFDPSHRLVLSGSDVSTRYTLRGESMYRAYAAYILSGIAGKKGRYLAFFPSYRVLTAVREAFLELCEIVEAKPELLVQEPGMKEAEKEAFLRRFEEPAEEGRSLVGFCVMGGSFSEGIDLTEDKLIGAFIVGTALPQVCTEREILKTYFTRQGEDGFAYAYLYSGMNRVLQAAGRVIRTAKDCGIVLLLDERFQKRQYRELFPREWKKVEDCTLHSVKNKIDTFWSELLKEGETK